ncbi:hypothetical protein [Streptomyces qinglanensis]|uniref:hypothetical protein n=1 Tax=Streptomyces qinglanensis TaxID=943816 RepID=UPI0037B9647A
MTDSLALSALVGALPLLTLFALPDGRRLKAHWSGPAALGVSVVVGGRVGPRQPLHLALLAGTEGAAFELFPLRPARCSCCAGCWWPPYTGGGRRTGCASSSGRW